MENQPKPETNDTDQNLPALAFVPRLAVTDTKALRVVALAVRQVLGLPFRGARLAQKTQGKAVAGGKSQSPSGKSRAARAPRGKTLAKQKAAEVRRRAIDRECRKLRRLGEQAYSRAVDLDIAAQDHDGDRSRYRLAADQFERAVAAFNRQGKLEVERAEAAHARFRAAQAKAWLAQKYRLLGALPGAVVRQARLSDDDIVVLLGNAYSEEEVIPEAEMIWDALVKAGQSPQTPNPYDRQPVCRCNGGAEASEEECEACQDPDCKCDFRP